MTRRMSAPLPARVAAIVVTAVVAITLAACADDGGDEESATRSEDPPSGETGAEGDGAESDGGDTGDGGGAAAGDAILLGASFEPASTLWSVTLKTDEQLASVTAGGAGVELTDVATAPDGTVYGLGFDALYRVDPASGQATGVGPVGVGDVNALVVTPEGRLLAGANEGALVELDPATGAGTVVGVFGGGLTSGGDLAVGPDGTLYAALTDSTGQTGVIATVDPATGTATRVVDLPYPAVYGLAFAEDELYALTYALAPTAGGTPTTTGAPTSAGTSCPMGALVRVDLDTGDAEELRCLDFPPGGASPP